MTATFARIFDEGCFEIDAVGKSLVNLSLRETPGANVGITFFTIVLCTRGARDAGLGVETIVDFTVGLGIAFTVGLGTVTILFFVAVGDALGPLPL